MGFFMSLSCAHHIYLTRPLEPATADEETNHGPSFKAQVVSQAIPKSCDCTLPLQGRNDMRVEAARCEVRIAIYLQRADFGCAVYFVFGSLPAVFWFERVPCIVDFSTGRE